MEASKPKSPIIQELIIILKDALHRAENDKCDEKDVIRMVAKFNAESKGFFDKKSFVNYDKAMRIVGIRQRTKFKEICNEHHIEMNYVNNQPVGFRRTEIEDLVIKLREENKRKTEV